MQENTMPKKRSCASRLHEIQREVGMTDKELKQACKDVTRPRVVDLPEIHIKVEKSKEQKREEKAYSKAILRRQYEVAYWYLEEYLNRADAEKLYLRFAHITSERERLNALVREALRQVEELRTMMRMIGSLSKTDAERKEVLKELIKEHEEDNERRKAKKSHYHFQEIPVEWSDEFKRYCKKHPLTGRNMSMEGIYRRREKFLKQMTKKEKKHRKKSLPVKRMRMYDPVYRVTEVRAKDMYEDLMNLRNSLSNQEKLRESFDEFVEQLHQSVGIGVDAMKSFKESNKQLIKNMRKRVKNFEHRVKKWEDYEKQYNVSLDTTKPYVIEMSGHTPKYHPIQ